MYQLIYYYERDDDEIAQVNWLKNIIILLVFIWVITLVIAE